MKQQLLIACALFLLLFADGRSLTAAEAGSGGVPPDMTPEKLEKEVQRRFKYIEQRLLSGRSARTIEESGNARAMEILRRSKERMGTISQWISEGRLEDAYLALRELGRSMREALQLARAKERSEKKVRDGMEEAKVVNDAYFERVKKRGATSAKGDIKILIDKAKKARARADLERKRGDYVTARVSYEESTRLLKDAISLFREGRK